MSRALAWSTLTLAVLFATPALAQEDGPSFVVKGGLVASDFYATGTDFGVLDTGSFGTMGFGAGVATRLPLGDRFALQAEALWLRKATDVAVQVEPFPQFGFSDLLVRLRTDYLEVPIMLRYELRAGDTRPYFFAGPAIAVKLASDVSGRQLDLFIDRGYAASPFGDHVRDVDTLLGLGAGVDFGVSRRGGGSVEVRASWGLQDVFSFDDAPRPTRSRAKSRSYLLLVGYRF